MGLFTLEDSFIDSMCMSTADSDVAIELTGALEAGRQAVLEAVQRKLQHTEWAKWADEFEVILQDGVYVVMPPAEIENEILAAEYGGPELGPPRPILRQALQQAMAEVQRIITAEMVLT